MLRKREIKPSFDTVAASSQPTINKTQYKDGRCRELYVMSCFLLILFFLIVAAVLMILLNSTTTTTTTVTTTVDNSISAPKMKGDNMMKHSQLRQVQAIITSSNNNKLHEPTSNMIGIEEQEIKENITPNADTTIKIIGEQQQAQNKSSSHLVIKTIHGTINVAFLPESSPESVQYIQDLLSNADEQHTVRTFHRAEKDLLIQGVLTTGSENHQLTRNTVFGKCPDDPGLFINQPKQRQLHEKCHGPIMTKGMVAWAAGSAGGPHFFINTFHKPVDWWEHQHTVWGEIRLDDTESFSTLDRIYQLPVTKKGVMNTLNDPVHFTLQLE